MSWKSLVTAGLVCLLASPVFAAPSISVIKGGTVASNYLDSPAGNVVWNVQISNTNPVPTGSSPLAAELGFTTSAALASAATNLSTGAGDDFDTVNPGNPIFGWEVPGVGTNGKPEGIQSNIGAKQVFSALGSIDFNSVGPHDYIQIKSGRPVVSLATPNQTQTVTVSGAYAGKGRIAELTGATTTANYDTYNNVFSRTFRGGDADLNGAVNFDDFQSALLLNYNQSGKSWQHGDFDGNGTVNFDDFQILLTQYNTSYTIGAGAGSGLSAGSVPEPASIALLGLALLGSLGIIRRRG